MERTETTSFEDLYFIARKDSTTGFPAEGLFLLLTINWMEPQEIAQTVVP